jgi:hypothetical protein
MSRETFAQLTLEHYCNQPYNLGNNSLRLAQISLHHVADPAAFVWGRAREKKVVKQD